MLDNAKVGDKVWFRAGGNAIIAFICPIDDSIDYERYSIGFYSSFHTKTYLSNGKVLLNHEDVFDIIRVDSMINWSTIQPGASIRNSSGNTRWYVGPAGKHKIVYAKYQDPLLWTSVNLNLGRRDRFIRGPKEEDIVLS